MCEWWYLQVTEQWKAVDLQKVRHEKSFKVMEILNLTAVTTENYQLCTFPHRFFFSIFYLWIQFHSKPADLFCPLAVNPSTNNSAVWKQPGWPQRLNSVFPPLTHYVLCSHVFYDPLIIHTCILLLFLAMHANLVHLCISYWEAQWEWNRVGVAQGDLSQLCFSCAQKINIKMIDFSLRQRDRIVTLMWKNVTNNLNVYKIKMDHVGA